MVFEVTQRMIYSCTSHHCWLLNSTLMTSCSTSSSSLYQSCLWGAPIILANSKLEHLVCLHDRSATVLHVLLGTCLWEVVRVFWVPYVCALKLSYTVLNTTVDMLAMILQAKCNYAILSAAVISLCLFCGCKDSLDVIRLFPWSFIVLCTFSVLHYFAIKYLSI